MNTEKHPIDQLFRERLGSFEQVPPAGLLDKIHQEVAFRGRIRRIGRLRTITSIAAALLLVSLAGWYALNQEPKAPNEFAGQIQQEQPQPAISSPKQETVEPSSGNLPSSEKQNTTAAPAAKQMAQLTAPSIQKSRKPVTHKTTDKQPAGKTPEATVAAVPDKPAGEEAAAKGETKKETAPKNNQRKNEYYADQLFNQPVAQPAPKRTNWSLRAEVSPMFPADKLNANINSASGTKTASTVSGGMLASIQVNDKIKISSGIRFSQMKQGTHTEYMLSQTSGITYLEPVKKAASISGDVSLYLPSVSSVVYSNGMKAAASNSSPMNPVTTSSFVSDLTQEFKYLEVPIQATYKLIDQKQLSVGFTGGISTNFLVGNYAAITQNGISLSSGDTNNIRKVLYSGSAGIELGYDLGKNLVLTVEPRIKQYLHSISSNEQVSYRPMQLGIFTGITYSFR